MKKRHFFVAGIFLFAAAAYAVSGMAGDTESAEQPAEKKPVRTVVLSPAPFQLTEEFSGFVRGIRQADVAPKASGYIIRLLKEEGESVRAGEALAEIDGAELSAAKESALRSLQSIGKTLDETEKYYDQKVDEAKAALENAKDDYESGDASASDVDVAEESLKSAKKFRDAQLASLKTEKAGIEGLLIVSDAHLKNTIVRAPFSGVITQKKASPGSFAAPGVPIYAIASPEALEAAVSLPGTVARGVAAGTSVRIFSENVSDTLEGTVFSIAQAVGEATQQSVARIRFASADAARALRLGDHVRVAFPSEALRTALLVPEESIMRIYDDAFVSVVENGRVKRYPVSLGAEQDGQREALSGLEAGAHIIVDGQYAAEDNQEAEETYAAR